MPTETPGFHPKSELSDFALSSKNSKNDRIGLKDPISEEIEGNFPLQYRYVNHLSTLIIYALAQKQKVCTNQTTKSFL